MRHSRLPLYAILGAVLIIAAWAHSFWKTTNVSYRWGPPHVYRGFGAWTTNGYIGFWAGRPYQGLFGFSPTGVRFEQMPARRSDTTLEYLMPIFIGLGAPDRPTFVINYYLLLILYIAAWLTFLTCLSRRRKSHLTPPLPNRAD